MIVVEKRRVVVRMDVLKRVMVSLEGVRRMSIEMELRC